MTDTKLYEDTIYDYSGNNREYIELENNKFEEVKDLIGFFPNQLLNQSDTIFGCPDCTDGDGIYVQYLENGM